MFKRYSEIDDVVSLLIYSQNERSFLLEKDANGEYWIPSSKVEKNCWKSTAHKMFYEVFGVDAVSQCTPLRIYKIWLPNHQLSSVYHAIYKVCIKTDVKKKTKIKPNVRSRLSWLNSVELERQRAHASLRSPELTLFIQMAIGEQSKDIEPLFKDSDVNLMVEVCEDNVILGGDAGGGAVTLATANFQLISAANYNRDDQIRLYREFMTITFPAIYMSQQVFTTFMTDIGWQRSQCSNLFRAADVTGRGGLSFLETMLWCAAMEPHTQHSGIPAELRCRYIFRFFDSNRDLKLEYIEFKELVAAARMARQLPVDALSVAKDADVCLRQLGIQPNSQLPLAEFLRAIGELRLRGTSSMLRSPRSIIAYIQDLHENEREQQLTIIAAPQPVLSKATVGHMQLHDTSQASSNVNPVRRTAQHPDYNVATFSVRLRKSAAHNDMLELYTYDDNTVSPSTARLLTTAITGVNSMDVLGPRTSPVEALAAVHYFAAAVEKPANVSNKRASVATGASIQNKCPWSWSTPAEEVAMGALLLKLAEAVRPIIAAEPRLLRLNAPVYVIGDLHGNLNALMALEAALWPSGAALAPARILFLGDYVDRGPHGTELMAYLLATKLQRPHGILLIRGNHETRDIQKMFTFYSECLTKYGEVEGGKIWSAVNQVFDVLPLAAVVDDKVFCCHGGIPPPWVCPLITAIDKVPVPLPRPAEQSTIAWELLWNDPVKVNKMTATLALELTANEGFAANTKRGTGHVFDQTAIDRFLVANQLSHVVRAHELHQNGFMCQLRGRLISVFSSTHYCGGTNDCGVALLEGGKVRLIRVTND